MVVAACVFLSAAVLPAQPGNAPDARKLEQRLKRFPEADANGDGVLTEQEAREHQQRKKKAKSADSPTAADGKAPAPNFANVRYGPHERNVLDLWRPPNTTNVTPVLIFFHGGSFKAGDKANVLTRPIFRECLAAGIAVVSANYRFSTDAPYPAPMHDGARAVQFVRSKAGEWRLDPARIAVSGSSAGATLALWIALHDDRAAPASPDPIARQSTRVACASPHSGTAGLEPAYFRQHAGVAKLGAALFQLFGTNSREELDAPDKRALTRDASPLLHASRDDPPLFLTYAGEPKEAPFAENAPQNAWIHHVSLGLPLKARYDELKLPCEIYHQGNRPAAGAEIAFLKKHLLGAPSAH